MSSMKNTLRLAIASSLVLAASAGATNLRLPVTANPGWGAGAGNNVALDGKPVIAPYQADVQFVTHVRPSKPVALPPISQRLLKLFNPQR